MNTKTRKTSSTLPVKPQRRSKPSPLATATDKTQTKPTKKSGQIPTAKNSGQSLKRDTTAAVKLSSVPAQNTPGEPIRGTDVRELAVNVPPIDTLFAEAKLPSASFESDGSAKTSSSNAEQGALPFGLMRPSDLKTAPDREYLVNGLIARGEVGFLVGASSAGKTFLILDLALAANQGRSWAGFPIPKAFGVVYLAGEGQSGLRARIVSAHDYHGCDLENERLLVGPQIVDLGDSSSAHSVDRFISDMRINKPYGLDLGLVVIDTFRVSLGQRDENSSADTALAIQNAYKIATALDCAVMILHHSGKSGEGYRGSSAIKANADFLYEVAVTGNTRQFSFDKHRDLREWSPRRFALKDHGKSAVVEWRDEDSPFDPPQPKQAACDERILEVIQGDPKASFTVRSMAEQLGTSVETTRSAIRKLVENKVLTENKISAKQIEYKAAGCGAH